MYRLDRYGPDMNNRQYSKKPIYVLLLLALLMIVAHYVFIMVGGNDGLFIYASVQYFGPMLLGLLFLLAALVVAIHHKIRKNSVRKIVTWLLAFGLMILAIAGGSAIYAMYLLEHPVAYYTSPEGTNRLVIMNGLSERMDTASVYNAYPMKSRFFYRPTFMKGIDAPRGIESIEWEGEDLVHVSLTDIHNEHHVITIDFTKTYEFSEDADDAPEASPSPEVSPSLAASPADS